MLGSIVWLQLFEVAFDEMLGEGNDELSILADGLYVPEGLYSDGIVLVAPLIEPHDHLPLQVVAYRHLALASVPLLLLCALDHLIQHQLLHLFPLFQSADHLCVLKELSVVILKHTIEVLLLALYLLGIFQGVQGLYYILYLSVFNLLEFLSSGHHFPLLGGSLHVLDCDELLLRQLHPFLQGFGLDPLVLGELRVELLSRKGRAESDDEEGLALLLQEMGEIGVLSEILAEVFIA